VSFLLQIHRSDTPSVDVIIDRFTTTAALKLDTNNNHKNCP